MHPFWCISEKKMQVWGFFICPDISFKIWINGIDLQSQMVKIHLICREQLGLSLVAGKEDDLSLYGF